MQFAVSPDNLLFFCSVTASVAAAFALVSLYRHLAAHRRPQPSSGSAAAGRDSPEAEEELLPLSAAAAGLPPFMYSRLVRHSGKGAAGGTECAVCLGVIQVGAMVKLLPACSHVYHRDCIDLWLSARSTCPLCRCTVGGAAESETGGRETPQQQLAQPAPAPAILHR
ncbi:hypothetical protein U9M48_027453 [Paspalum notatum var. saurae]|uniref:RING-type E3 ubiquitin transferase n=1 Tax=Paspalum notatum var. saurae TaxID=547442 RepID=A0AAQ3X0G7_PASNO